MANRRFYVYGNSGGIGKVLQDLSHKPKTYGSVEEALNAIQKKHAQYLDMHNLHVEYYTYDNRLEKDVFMITTDRFGDEDYIATCGTPQFVAYMIAVDSSIWRRLINLIRRLLRNG